MTGSVVAACTSETSAGALGASTSSHCAPTVCIQVPVQLIKTPIHSQRNARFRNGAQAGASGTAVLVVEPLLCELILRDLSGVLMLLFPKRSGF